MEAYHKPQLRGLLTAPLPPLHMHTCTHMCPRCTIDEKTHSRHVASHTLFTLVSGGPGVVGLAPGEGEVGALDGGVEGASLVPLHVADATHRLDLGVRGPEVAVVLVISLLQQVLQPTVARVLVPNPPASRGVGCVS